MTRTTWRGNIDTGYVATINGFHFHLAPKLDGWECSVYIGHTRWVMDRVIDEFETAKQRCRKFASMAKGDRK